MCWQRPVCLGGLLVQRAFWCCRSPWVDPSRCNKCSTSVLVIGHWFLRDWYLWHGASRSCVSDFAPRLDCGAVDWRGRLLSRSSWQKRCHRFCFILFSGCILLSRGHYPLSHEHRVRIVARSVFDLTQSSALFDKAELLIERQTRLI